jgi:hypothetical protein
MNCAKIVTNDGTQKAAKILAYNFSFIDNHNSSYLDMVGLSGISIVIP